MRWHPYKNIDPFLMPEIADKLLNQYWGIAESLKIKTFLLEGTCLGFVRDGGYIIGDNDIDVGILNGLEELSKELVKNGFISKQSSQKSQHFVKDDILLDIWSGFNNQKFLQSFDKVTYNGREYDVPHPVEEYLKSFYGDWKIKKHRKIYKGQLAISTFSLNKVKTLPKPCQNIFEWQLFLEFVETYFKNRNIGNPIIVELGTGENKQKRFYEGFLRAEYIGVDISDKQSTPDILGSTLDESTLNKLKELLNGRMINLLFIDSYHVYDHVKREYEMYSPFVKNIVAFHDIMTEQVTVKDFWNELYSEEKYTKLTFYKKQSHPYQFGIGIIVKE